MELFFFLILLSVSVLLILVLMSRICFLISRAKNIFVNITDGWNVLCLVSMYLYIIMTNMVEKALSYNIINLSFNIYSL